MELRILRYFLAVAREENISRAAEILHITQPTLSRQLMELEETLGVTLFHRSKKNRGITLTEEGQLLYRRAEEIIALAEKTKAELSTCDEQTSGDVYIGGGETEGMRLIAQSIKQLHQTYPHVRFHLFSGNADDVTERLDKGLLDFGVLISPAHLEKYDYIQLPFADIWGLLLPKDSPLAQQAAIRPQDLIGLPLIVSRQTMVRNEISGWLGQDMTKLTIVCTYNLLYNAALMVEEGLGCALCLDKLIHFNQRNGICFRPFTPLLEARLYLVWKKHQVFSKAAEKFLTKLQTTILAQ